MLLGNGIFFLLDYDGYAHILSLLSSDGKIEYPEFLFIKIQVLIIVVFMVLYCIVAKPLKEMFLQMSTQNKYGYLVTIGLLVAYYYTPDPAFAEDGFLEYATVVFELIASVLLFLSIHKKEGTIGKVFKIVLAILFFIVAMEEISWGQNIFGWGTPEALAEINYQNETNMHNLFNPYYRIFYVSFNLCLGIVLCVSMDLKLKLLSLLKLEKYSYILPTRDFDLYGFIFLLLSLYSFRYIDGELTEIIFSFFAAMYALYQYTFSKKNRL